MEPQKLERDEVAAAMSARRELGPQYELELAQSLVDRVNAVIDQRLAASPRRPGPDWAQMTLGLGSLALSVPLVAIVSLNVDHATVPILLVFAVIAAVNLAYAITRTGGRDNRG
ncbi:hypothetical protein Skr01_26060 [Sphaerisporangium krabiense]|uniref:Uncharacterized protein n=1 Tax=Sphaerisporangium krabiense TaxID=763782 RepID=A0A7W8ZAK4_9ACTN|nr:hypothetical protein [Sphaerisporangium krabiense]MBB5630524.1 hypothetical protein [Sphaerisporangium krabiense]GII62521.1 hypothetical protein Skr01_26060 [Sphaerisporangium krabiense]